MVCTALLFGALVGPQLAVAGEKAEAPPKEAVEDTTTPEIVAKVGGTTITRRDLNMHRRQLSFGLKKGQALPNNKIILKQLINRSLWQQHFQTEKITPKPEEVRAAIIRLDAELKRRGATYGQFLQARGLKPEEHAEMIGYDISMRRLVTDVQTGVKEDTIKAEFDAHPEFYDGSRVLIGQIFIDTSNIANDAEELKEAKRSIDAIYQQLEDGKAFEKLASDKSEGAAAARGGQLGWLRRKVNDEIEPLVATAWKLKKGEHSKPVQGPKGWHILKVENREPAYLTFFGARAGVIKELVQNKLRATLDGLREKTKIEEFI
ncbi:peptidylprolyl isomerase [bacterium]|nr:peptidylprolyl isomerase [bacterium]